MSFPQGPGNGNNPNPNNNRNNGNPFTNPFNRGNNGNNGKGNKENRPIWQSPWLWGAVLVVMVVLMFQMFAGGGTKTIDTKDGFALINQGKATYAEITDNKQVVRLELKNDYTKKNADTGKVTNYGKNVQFYYTFAQGAQVAKAVENGDLEKGWTSNIEQTSVMSYLITSILPFIIFFALFWWLMSRMGGAGGMLGMGGKKNSGKLLEGQTPTTKFADVAGEDEAVAEVEEIKDFLKDPSKYKALGARIPRGVLLYGPPGLGKTTLAGVIANEMGVNIRVTSGPAIEKPGDLAALLTNLNPGDILFIDEIHRLNRVVEEILYPAMEDFAIDIIVGKGPSANSIRLDLPKFTLVGATTRAGQLSAPLRDRFGVNLRLELYTPEELAKIVTRSAAILGMPIDPKGAMEIASRSRGTPRIANRFLRRVRDFAEVMGDGTITKEAADLALRRLEVDKLGLDNIDRRMLTAIIQNYGGGPVGLETLAATIGEEAVTLEDVYEPYLMQLGFLTRTPRGRCVTALAYDHLHIPYEGQSQFSI